MASTAGRGADRPDGLVSRIPGWLANLALATAATLVPLAVLEGGLRLAGTMAPSMYEPDSALIYRLTPGGTKTFVHRPANGGGRATVEVNRDGYRGPPLRAPGSARRIVVYGDSFIEGEFADDSLTFVRMLERRLARRAPTEVVNAGVVGYGPDQAYLRMQHDLGRLKPELVVLAIFADNDMGDLVRDRLFRLGADSALEAHQVVLHPTLVRTLRAQARPTGWRRFHLVRWIERTLGRGVAVTLPATRAKGDGPAFSMAGYAEWAMANAERQYREARAQPDTVLDMLGDSYDVDVSATPDAPSARYKVALMDRLLGAIAQDLTARGVPLVLVNIPSPIDACLTYDVRIDPARYPHYERRRLSGIVDSLAARHGIRRLDLWGPFISNDPCSLYYRDGDLHWKERAQSLAADLLADSLAAWHLVP